MGEDMEGGRGRGGKGVEDRPKLLDCSSQAGTAVAAPARGDSARSPSKPQRVEYRRKRSRSRSRGRDPRRSADIAPHHHHHSSSSSSRSHRSRSRRRHSSSSRHHHDSGIVFSSWGEWGSSADRGWRRKDHGGRDPYAHSKGGGYQYRGQGWGHRRSRSRSRSRCESKRRREDYRGRSQEHQPVRRREPAENTDRWDDETTDGESQASKDTSPAREIKPQRRALDTSSSHAVDLVGVGASRSGGDGSRSMSSSGAAPAHTSPFLFSKLRNDDQVKSGSHDSGLGLHSSSLGGGWSPAGTTDGVGLSPASREEDDQLISAQRGEHRCRSPLQDKKRERPPPPRDFDDHLRPAYSCARGRTKSSYRPRSPSPDHSRRREDDGELYFAKRRHEAQAKLASRARGDGDRGKHSSTGSSRVRTGSSDHPASSSQRQGHSAKKLGTGPWGVPYPVSVSPSSAEPSRPKDPRLALQARLKPRQPSAPARLCMDVQTTPPASSQPSKAGPAERQEARRVPPTPEDTTVSKGLEVEQEDNQAPPSPWLVDFDSDEEEEEEDKDAAKEQAAATPSRPPVKEAGVVVTPQGQHRGWTPLIIAIMNKDLEAVTRCLEEGAQVDAAVGANQMTALHFACTHGFLAAVQELLSHGADWKITDSTGRTCLMIASGRGNAGIVSRLLEAPQAKQTGNLNKADANGATAMWYAASRGSADTVNALLFVGADVTMEDKNHNLTPAGIAKKMGHDAVAQQLEVEYEIQAVQKKVKVCKSIFKKWQVDQLDNAGPQGCPTAGQLTWGCLIKVMGFLKEHGAGLTAESIWLEIGSGPMRPGMTALQCGAKAAIGVEVVTERHLHGMRGGTAICKYVEDREKMLAAGRKPKGPSVNWRAYHVEMDAGHILRFPPNVTHIYMFVSCPAELLGAVSDAWNACGPQGPEWIVTFETEKTMQEYEFHATFVAAISGLSMAGSNEGKTARLYRRAVGLAEPQLDKPVPEMITQAIDFITAPDRTLREVIEDGETRRWLLYEKTCAGGRRAQPADNNM